MFKFKLIVLSLALASLAQASPLAAPTAFQVDPGLSGICMNDGPATTAAASSTDGVTLTGTASLQGYICKLKVHAGRGPGIRVFSACADVTWDLAGNLISVVPVSSAPAYSIVCD